MGWGGLHKVGQRRAERGILSLAPGIRRAGTSTARTAEHQNHVATDALASADCHFLFSEAELHDRTDEIVRTPEVVRAVETATVGPPKSGYDEALPLDAEQIRVAAQVLEETLESVESAAPPTPDPAQAAPATPRP